MIKTKRKVGENRNIFKINKKKIVKNNSRKNLKKYTHKKNG